MNGKRIEWIDALKGFGIILVTFAHLNPWLILETHIYSFHMCLFFFVSGYLFKKGDKLGEFILKKTKSLLIPFLVWNLLSSLFEIMSGGGLEDTLLRFLMIDGKMCWNAPIWFLLVLFMTEIIYAIVMEINDSKITVLLVIVISVVLWALFGSYSLTLKINLVPLALCFYGIGDIIHREFGEKTLSNTLTVVSVVAFGALSVVFGAVLNGRISYSEGVFGNVCFCVLAGVFGTLFYYLIFKNCGFLSNKFLITLGKNSMIIMVGQYWIFKAIDTLSQKLFGISVWHYRSTVKAALICAFTIFIIIVVVAFVKKLFKNNKKVLNIIKYFGIK